MFQRSPLLRCLALYRHTPVRFVLTVVLFALLNLSLSWQQWLLGRAVDDVTGDAAAGCNDVLWHWVTLILALAALRGVVQYGTNILSHVIGQRLMVSLREMILAQAQRLPLAYHLQHGMGEMVTRTTRDVDKVRDALITFWRQVVDTFFVVLAAVGLLLWYDIWLGVVVLALTALGLGLFIHQSERLVVLDRAVGRAYDRVNQDLSEGISGVRVIKSFGLETQRVEAFGAQVAVFVQHARAALWYASTRIPVPQIVVALGHVWILAYGAWLVAQGRMGLGELTASLLIATTLVFRIEGIGRVMQAFADARASAARIWDMLDTPVQIVSAEGLLPQGALGVRLESVGLTLVEGGSRVLAACSLEVRPGECVALVGATGAGKSSLMALLPRFLDAGEGRVSLRREDAWRDVRECDLPALRRRVHLVTQESFLFADTLRANLLMARPEASEAQLLEALQRAALDDLPALLAQGLDTVLGDRGVTLSGGQRQRMCLARALLAAPDLLVLDDATSALDSVTEKRILDGIRSAPRPPTVLLVASKLSTVLQADRVVMLAAGAVQAEGSHEDLVRSSAAYRELMGLGHGAQ